MKRNTADDKTAEWLKDNGMSAKDFAAIDLKLLQAQRAAHTLLTNHQDWLTERQRKHLTEFKQRVANKKQRQYITKDQALGILNLAKTAHRKDFKQRRTSKAQQGR
jgi:hypothetical protein